MKNFPKEKDKDLQIARKEECGSRRRKNKMFGGRTTELGRTGVSAIGRMSKHFPKDDGTKIEACAKKITVSISSQRRRRNKKTEKVPEWFGCASKKL